MTLSKVIKIILAALLFLCLLKMPYGYYQLVRFISMTLFVIFAYEYRKNIPLMIVFISLAVLFQPIFKIHLGREIWNIVDVIVGILLLLLVVGEKWVRKLQ
ncbi:MAG TPA: DUF6804 family protein [Bacteroidia bacterium]|nr:DUF6804 family protein [Bacteroidia bacterium]